MTENERFARLGKRELGRHAFEDRMPEQIARIVRNEAGSNRFPGVIPKLMGLLEHDSHVDVAYLCTRAALQVCKLPEEGGHFCGYRNMQMLCLSLPAPRVTTADGTDVSKKLDIPQLQELIEKAWDAGYNPHGRVVTGGIRGTRKHVGTSEAEALLLSLNVPCTGTAFSGSDAWQDLLDAVEAYFAAALLSSPITSGIHQTDRPPVFLQRPNHSITVVGLERLRSGTRRLLAFDPAYRPPPAMIRPPQGFHGDGWRAKWVLAQYRKSERYLRRYNRFETLTVDQSP